MHGASAQRLRTCPGIQAMEEEEEIKCKECGSTSTLRTSTATKSWYGRAPNHYCHKHFEYHYHENFYTTFFAGNASAWSLYVINVVLPPGSSFHTTYALDRRSYTHTQSAHPQGSPQGSNGFEFLSFFLSKFTSGCVGS